MIDILIVEDNPELGTMLQEFLRAEGYVVSVAKDGPAALAFYGKYGAKLLILDICLPGLDGMYILNKVRERANTPVIMVSAKNTKDDKLSALLSGADDYIEKPYDIDILIAKVKGIFRRRLATDSLSDGDISLDLVQEKILKNGIPLEATVKEFELMKLFLENKGHTLQKQYIFDVIWGMDSESEFHTLAVHINRLREKIEKNPKEPKKIITVWGKGYRYE